jgi:hypothetical protein
MMEFEATPPLWPSRVKLEVSYTVDSEGYVYLQSVEQMSNGKSVILDLTEEQREAIKEAAFEDHLEKLNRKGACDEAY